MSVGDASPVLPVWYTEPDWDTERPRNGGKQVWAQFTAVNS